MWFKKKEKKENKVGFDKEWDKEIERYEKLLDAYELMVREGGFHKMF